MNNQEKPEVVLLDKMIEYHQSKGNNELVDNMKKQKEAIIKNKKMTYAEMRELMG